MKKFLLVFIILLVGCGTKTDIQKFKLEYEQLNNKYIEMIVDEKVNLKYLSIFETIDFLENKTGILYIGFPTCPWCRNILPVLFNLSIDNNKKIYYFNPREAKDDESYNKLKNILDEYLTTNSKGEKTLYVPDVYFVKDGKIMGHHLGSVESQTDPNITLDEGQKQELYNIYNELLEKIK